MRFFTGVAVLVVLLMAGSILAQDEEPPKEWQTEVVADLTTTQTAYSDSWTGGEAGSFNWVGNLNGTAEKQMSPGFNVQSTLKLSFGQTHTQDAETKKWEKPTKSTDLIDWETVGRFTMNGLADPYVALRIESQFLDASVESYKRYLTPLRFTESVGASRTIYKKGDDKVVTRFGFALRQNLVDVIIDTANKVSERFTDADGGVESVTDITMKVNDKLSYVGKLTLYKALFFTEDERPEGVEHEDNWSTADVNFENTVRANITKLITVNLYVQLLYDKQVVDKARFKETLGIGVTLKLL